AEHLLDRAEIQNETRRRVQLAVHLGVERIRVAVHLAALGMMRDDVRGVEADAGTPAVHADRGHHPAPVRGWMMKIGDDDGRGRARARGTTTWRPRALAPAPAPAPWTAPSSSSKRSSSRSAAERVGMP